MYDNINELLQDLGLAEREARYWHENYNALQESIVHCRDCKYYSQILEHGKSGLCDRDECADGCNNTCWQMYPEDFCSRGERK